MFTGIIQSLGEIRAIETGGSGELRVTVGAAGLDLSRCALGDSIAVAGICLTVIDLGPGTFAAEVSRETLSVTMAGSWRAGQRVNLESALRVGDALGGHIVSGHVDGVAELQALHPDAGSLRMQWRAPAQLARDSARQGAGTRDGVSLTVNEVQDTLFGVNIIPHTQALTTLGTLQAGARANIEVDLMARYAERLLPATD
jgi:riboflavin synthase